MNKRALEALILIGFATLIVGLVGSLFIFNSPESHRIIWPCLLGAVMGLAVFAGFILWGRGGSDPEAPTVVASLPDEMSANALVVQLEAHGIRARAIGGHTSSDLVCDVKVVVPESDHELAMGVLQIMTESNT